MRPSALTLLVVSLALSALHVACDGDEAGSSVGSFDGGATGTFDAGAGGGSSEDAAPVPTGEPDASADAAPVDAGEPGTLPTSRRADTQVDFVGPGDNATTPDGTPDGTMTVTVVGPIDGLILVTTDAAGAPAGGQQWDTLVGADPIPPGFPFSVGSQTWLVGVYDGTTKLNDANGRISLPAGPRALTLVASPSGFFTTGQHFRLHARNATTGTWSAGPVFTW